MSTRVAPGVLSEVRLALHGVFPSVCVNGVGVEKKK